MIQRYYRPLLWSVIAGMVLYGAAVAISNPRAISAAIGELDARVLFYIAGLLAINYGLRFARWHYYLHKLGYRVNPGRSLAIYLAAFSLATTPGKAGEAIRSVYLKRDGVNYTHSLAALFSERLLDVIVLVMLATSTAFLFPNSVLVITLTSVLLLASIPVIHSQGLHAIARGWLARRPATALTRIGEKLIRLLQSASGLLVFRPLLTGLSLGFVAWLSEGVIFYLVLEAMNVPIAPVIAIGLWAISMLVGAISFLPGGLGTTEAAIGSLLMLLGTDGPTAVAATLTYRICTLWFAVCLGLIVGFSLEWAVTRNSSGSEVNDRETGNGAGKS